jgi:hypothetical protein
MAGFTGQGTIVALSGGAIGCVRSITLPTWSMDSIDASCLSTTGFMKKIAADLVDAGTVQVTAVFEPTDEPFTVNGAQDTLTVTLPSAGATSGILTGTGFVSECSLPSIEIGGLLEQTFTFTFDGEEDTPLFTAGSEA